MMRGIRMGEQRTPDFLLHSVCVRACVCDRIVVHGKSFLKAIYPFSAKVFNIGKEFKLPRSKVRESLSVSPNKVYSNKMAVP